VAIRFVKTKPNQGEIMTLSEENALITNALHGQENMADAVIKLGYCVGSDYKFARRDEATASCYINKDGTWHDYGSGTHGDWAALYMEKNRVSFREAVKEGLLIFSINVNTGASNYQFMKPNFSGSQKKSVQYETEEPLAESYVHWFIRSAKKHPVRFTELCRRLMPFASPTELKKAEWWFKIGYDAKKDRLTIPVGNEKGEVTNLFKYTPFTGLEQWKYYFQVSHTVLKQSSAPDAIHVYNDSLYKRQAKVKYISGRPRTLFNLNVLKYKPKVLYVLEGEKDVINATIAKKAAVTQGGAGMWKEQFAEKLLEACVHYGLAELPRIVIVQDHDKMGLRATIKIYEDLKEYFPDVKMAFWKNTTAKYVSTVCPDAKVGIFDASIPETVIPLKFDYTDYEVYRKRCS
jgi:DNA primase